jgi:hypothetical protein
MFATPQWAYVVSRITAYETGGAAWRKGWI